MNQIKQVCAVLCKELQHEHHVIKRSNRLKLNAEVDWTSPKQKGLSVSWNTSALTTSASSDLQFLSNADAIWKPQAKLIKTQRSRYRYSHYKHTKIPLKRDLPSCIPKGPNISLVHLLQSSPESIHLLVTTAVKIWLSNTSMTAYNCSSVPPSEKTKRSSQIHSEQLQSWFGSTQGSFPQRVSPGVGWSDRGNLFRSRPDWYERHGQQSAGPLAWCCPKWLVFHQTSHKKTKAD